MSPGEWTMGAFINIFNRRQQVLCVRQAYANQNWTTPGGRIEAGEDPLQAVLRETQEEVGIEVADIAFCGVYWKAYARDLVFSFIARYDAGQLAFSGNTEISHAGFFDVGALPSPMAANTAARIRAAAAGAAPRLTIFHTPEHCVVT